MNKKWKINLKLYNNFFHVYTLGKGNETRTCLRQVCGSWNIFYTHSAPQETWLSMLTSLLPGFLMSRYSFY